jgi:hypothetical protein
MLVEHGKPVQGLNASRIARRTAAATGPNGSTALVYITSVSLEDAANILALPNIFGSWAPRSALNLDGGTSSGLWADAVVELWPEGVAFGAVGDACIGTGELVGSRWGVARKLPESEPGAENGENRNLFSRMFASRKNRG